MSNVMQYYNIATMTIRHNHRLHQALRVRRSYSSSMEPSEPRRTFRVYEPKPGRSAAIGLGGYMLLIIPATTLGLGLWQTKRRKWKLDLIADLEEKTTAEPVPLPHDLTEIESLDYRKVFVTGTFDHAGEIYIGPRSRVSRDEEQGGGGGLMTTGDAVGWLVVTPFQLSDRDSRILVNRGWVPRKLLNPQARLAGQSQGEVRLIGVVRTSEKRQQFTPKNQTDTSKWQTRDIPALAAKLNTAPIFIDADASSTVPGGPVGGQTRVSLRNDHLSYMLTWFSLTAATTFMWAKKFLLK